MKLAPLQSSFAAGEISPALYGRYDQPGYQQGLRTCINAVVDSRGPVSRRAGFEHVHRVTPERECALHVMRLDAEEAYLVALTDLKLSVLPVNRALGPELVPNADFARQVGAWVQEGPGPVEWDEARQACRLPYSDAGTGTRISTYVEVPESGVDYLLQIRGTWQGANAADGVSVVVGPSVLYHELAAGDDYYQVVLTPTVLQFPIRITALGKTPGDDDGAHIIDLVSVRRLRTPETIKEFAAPWRYNNLMQVWAASPPNSDTMYLLHELAEPRKLTRVGTDSWTLSTVSFTSAPGAWVAQNYPTCVAFFQGRSWWAGCPANPSTFWASQSGSIEDLTQGTAADDGMELVNADRGRIVWLHGSKNLLLGSELGEYIVTSDGGVLKPGDTKTEQQSGWGSARVQPRQMGNETLFVSADGQRVRSMWYQWTDAAFLSYDLTYTNEQLVASGVKDLAFSSGPDRLIWAPTEGGDLVVGAYHRDGNRAPIYGWSRMQVASGQVMAVASIQCEGETQVWCAIRRERDGTSEVHIERLSSQIAVFLDGYAGSVSATKQTALANLDHLEGKTVAVLSDGVRVDDEVVSGGAITASSSGYELIAGTVYQSQLQTLPIVIPTKTGTTRGAESSWSEIWVQMSYSVAPSLNGEPAKRPDYLAADLAALQVYSGRVRAGVRGWEDDGTVLIETDEPYPLTVEAVFGDLFMGDS